MMRSDERENLMKMLYQMNMVDDYSEKSFEQYVDAQMKGKSSAYFKDTFEKFRNHQDKIDEVIDSFSINWKTSRMPAVDLSILRIAICEIFYAEDIPVSVSINEAVEMAKKFSTEKSSAFINGLLGKVVKDNEDKSSTGV